MIRIRYTLFAMLALLAAGCSSVPLSTIMRGASFSEGNVGFVDARALRVKVSLPKGFTLNVADTRLVADILSSTGSRKSEFALRRMETSGEKRSVGLVSKEDVDVTTYEMDLTDESVKSLRELQRFVAQGKVKDVSLQVKVTLEGAPQGSTSVKVWVDLMMSPMEGYFTLIDGATIPINKTVTYGRGPT